MERQKKVVDASIIAKWFLDEEDTKKALLLKASHIAEDSIIIVPDILFLEVLNALRYNNAKEELLKEANKTLCDLQLHVEKINEFILEKAIEISFRYNLTIYDSLYASLSQLHGCQLITADKELKKFPSAIAL